MSQWIITSFDMNDPNAIQHWKYIKRYKKNGKWRYVYADKKTHNAIKRKEELSDGYKKLSQDYYWPSSHRYNRNFHDWWDGNVSNKEYIKRAEKERKIQKQAIKNAHFDSINSKRHAETLIEKNSIKTLASDTIKKGKNAISNILKKVKK